jgi:hypothetical protein
VDASIRTTRSAADPLNLKQPSARLEIRRNFFSSRAVDAWKIMVLSGIKSPKTVNSFKMAYRKYW